LTQKELQAPGYTDAEHQWLHGYHGGEVFITYKFMYESVLDSSRTCCEFLIQMAALMQAWDAAIEFHDTLPPPGFLMIPNHLDFEEHLTFDLVNYKPPRPDSNLPKFEAFIVEVCGCSEKQRDYTREKIDHNTLTFFDNISDLEGWNGQSIHPFMLIGVPLPVRPFPTGSVPIGQPVQQPVLR
jgi:hypothetical protein